MRDYQEGDDPGERMNRRKVNDLRNDLRTQNEKDALASGNGTCDLRLENTPELSQLQELNLPTPLFFSLPRLYMKRVQVVHANYHLITAASFATVFFHGSDASRPHLDSNTRPTFIR